MATAADFTLATHNQHLEISEKYAFAEQRNRFGGLLLLPKNINASVNDDTFAEKLPIYAKQNMLASSLSPGAYRRNPGFLGVSRRFNFPFVPIAGDFMVESFAARQDLYRRLCEVIWDPAQFGLQASVDGAPAVTGPDIQVAPLA